MRVRDDKVKKSGFISQLKRLARRYYGYCNVLLYGDSYVCRHYVVLGVLGKHPKNDPKKLGFSALLLGLFDRGSAVFSVFGFYNGVFWRFRKGIPNRHRAV